MGDTATVELLQSAFQVILASHAKANMVQAIPVLIKLIILDGTTRIGSFGNRQDNLGVRKQVLGTEFGYKLEAQDVGVKIARAIFVCDGESEVVNRSVEMSAISLSSFIIFLEEQKPLINDQRFLDNHDASSGAKFSSRTL